jgi:hypothetical protein
VKEDTMIETAYFKKCPEYARRRILKAIEDLDIRELKIDRTIVPVYTDPDPYPVHYYTGEVTYTIRGYSMKIASTRVRNKPALKIKKTRRTP